MVATDAVFAPAHTVESSHQHDWYRQEWISSQVDGQDQVKALVHCLLQDPAK